MNEPRSAYIHVPFCAHRCGYCNFTLVAGRDDLMSDYLAALARELQQLESPREVDTLFFGGGTPTHLPVDQLRELLQLVRDWFPLAAGAEFSVEANPLDIDESKIELLVAHGVGRISLGVQSFDDAKLQLLERDHRAADVAARYALCRDAFPSVSLDLIFGTPDETVETWCNDLAAALALAPDHVSTYGLTFEKGTSFWSRRARGELAGCSEEVERTMYELAIQQLSAARFEHYEVSNFAREGHRCRHNEIYWTGLPFFAAGPGAASYRGGVRRVNHRSTTTWIGRLLAGEAAVVDEEQLAPVDRARERVVFGLRRLAGVDLQQLSCELEIDLDQLLAEPIQKGLELQLLTRDGDQLKLTHEGLLVSDALWGEFLAD